MTRFLWICLAGAIGTGARYLVSQGATRAFGPGFPYGTLIVNLVGCFLMAAIAQLAVMGTVISPTLRVVLATGFCGGLTTYSAFNLDTTRLLEEQTAIGIVNFVVMVLGCLAAGWLGTLAVRRLVGA
jgi:CrcB protein